MVQIFISYSRVDLVFVEQLYKRLQQMRPSIAVWYDKAPHGLLGGDKWWDSILDAIEASDIFIYVLSNDSVQSPYCQAEFQEARRLFKQIITIQARDRTRIEGELAEIQFVDMKNGVDDPEALVSLSGALERQLALARRLRPLTFQRTPKPTDDGARARQPEKPAASAPVPAASAPVPAASAPVPAAEAVSQPPHNAAWRDWRVLAAAALLLIAAVGLLPSLLNPDPDSNSIFLTSEPLYLSPTPPVGESEATLTAVAGQAQSVLQTATAEQQNRRATSEADSTLRAAADSATSVALAITQAVMTETATHSPFGGVGNPVTANAQWTPVMQEFDGVPMVKVPAGCFMMGSDDGQNEERPAHEQCFEESFWIDQTEVTRSDFERRGGTASDGFGFQGAERPVENVSWFEASDFCALRGARLPTEAEWEYAARGPDSRLYPWGDSWNPEAAVWDGNSNKQTAAVGSRPAGVSWVGALDMSGNVWEWTHSRFEDYPYVAGDGREADTGTSDEFWRVLRGGAWYQSKERELRSAYRVGYSPSLRYYYVGFRCARSEGDALASAPGRPLFRPVFEETPEAEAVVVTANDAWEPVIEEFDGVLMVMVPAGCFIMGDGNGSDDEQPAHEQCFDAAFWIDQTEVTQADFERLGGVKEQPNGFEGADRPVETITWFEVRDFCALRGGRLPTEAEWEYAARGPDHLQYPWGDFWDTAYLVMNRDLLQGTMPVGSIPAGVSWVGALDMSGNVQEWVSSQFQPYPYDPEDGREADDIDRVDTQRVQRGGAYTDIFAPIFTGANRYWDYSSWGNNATGFRCARSLDSARSTVTPLPGNEDSSISTALRGADNSVTANVQWTPVVQELGGIPMVKVPAGCFMMGNNDGNHNEKPAHQQCFDTPFWIGQTEVTNAQYQAFIEAGGYTNAAYWTAAGWAWQQNEGITQPACWTDSRFNKPDQPVVCVSWYEAAAYSAWLSVSSGQAFRLPTESEWEYAARGPDGWIYPWGDTWNADNAVTSETSSRQTAPVGSRPSGASWVGTLDMSGNVWEWVSSYPYSASDGREDLQDGARQVVRGGSWGSYSDFTRASFRYFFIPDFRDDYIGFRVLRPLLGL